MSVMSWSVSSWRPETLTAIPIGYPAARQAAPCEQASLRTHAPTSTISPVSSSSGYRLALIGDRVTADTHLPRNALVLIQASSDTLARPVDD